MTKMSAAAAKIVVGVLCILPTAASAAGPFQYHAVTPCRVLDTRVNGGQTTGAPLPNAVTARYLIQGSCGIPTGAAAVTLNITVITPTLGGDLRVAPVDGGGFPTVSTLNYLANEPALANGAIVPLGTVDPAKDIKFVAGMVGSGSFHMAVDVTGYFDD